MVECGGKLIKAVVYVALGCGLFCIITVRINNFAWLQTVVISETFDKIYIYVRIYLHKCVLNFLRDSMRVRLNKTN